MERKEAQLTDEARHALGEHGPLRQRVHVHLCDLLQDRRGGGGRKGTGLLLRGALRARCPMSRRGGRWRRARRDLTRRRRAHRHRQASSRGGALPKASQDRSHPGGGGGAPRGMERERGEREGRERRRAKKCFSFAFFFPSHFSLAFSSFAQKQRIKTTHGPCLVQPGQLVPGACRPARHTSVVPRSWDGRFRRVAWRSSVSLVEGHRRARKKKKKTSTKNPLCHPAPVPSPSSPPSKNKKTASSRCSSPLRSWPTSEQVKGEKEEEGERERCGALSALSHPRTPRQPEKNQKIKKTLSQATSPPCPLAASPSSTPRRAP